MAEKENKREKGKAGEGLASQYLENLGYQIIERNFQYGHGEIDLIANDGNELVFVEVKSRKSLEFGPPEYAITKGKLDQIKKVATAYLVQKDLHDQICRIDVVTILLQTNQEPVINLYRNAQL
jgi:putative endonuclease